MVSTETENCVNWISAPNVLMRTMIYNKI